ncbi:putative RING-H2 finger protein ATL53 [Coffea arabica]|uniref:RING-type E3 ubiquitin transferase n=1 Tax=Coffea arabica TaxID=13443 RepID=A0A6P6UC28_COFAR|nr:putative RING-H2 finger protein ATL53 [Coffea arabica]XP_027087791.1 putative RING-H2 finger protein ATL53 [Coffea arabica]
MPPSPPPTSSFEPSQWNPMVIALVAVVCCIFLLFSYQRILQLHCSHFGSITNSRNQGQSRRLHDAVADDPSLQLQSRGLDSFVMHSLPITQFKKNNEEETCKGITDCAVCLGEFEEGESLKHLPHCSHVFHVSCIDTWFQTHSSCPLCRSYVFNLTTHQEHTVSVYTLLETLSREEFSQDRAENYQILRSHVLQTSTEDGNSNSH